MGREADTRTVARREATAGLETLWRMAHCISQPGAFSEEDVQGTHYLGGVLRRFQHWL